MKLGRIAITGGSGRLGRFVIEELKGRAALTVVDIEEPDGLLDVGFIKTSALDFDALSEAFAGHDAVIHLAAIPNPRTATASVTFNVNVQGTFNVLNAAESVGVKRVAVASSDSALGLNYNPENWGIQYLPVDEDHPLQPCEFYGLSKEITEAICLRYKQRGHLEVSVLRPTHIVFEPEYPELAERGADVNNYHYWCYVHPADVATAFRLVLERDQMPYGPFFISAADTLSDQPTLDMLRARLGKLPPVRNAALYAVHPRASILDISRARTELGFEPRYDKRSMTWVPHSQS